MDYKQIVIVRNDLKLPKGKLAAQVAHASVEAVMRSSQNMVDEWHDQGMAKIVLKVDSEKELLEYQQRAKAQKLVAAVITDAGHTVVAPGTRTCVGIGPAETSKIDNITNNLKLL